MALLLTNGALFLHIPKTGGKFVSKMLNEQRLIARRVGNMHSDVFRSLAPQDYRSRLTRVVKDFPRRATNLLSRSREHDWTKGPRPEQPELDELPFMFCFVRHPVSWIESYFSYTVSQKWYYWSSEYDYLGFWHPNAVLNDIRSDNFNSFIEKLLRKRPGYVTEMFGWYTTSGVRFIGKQENLANDLVAVLEEMELPYDRAKLLQADKVNVSQSEGKKISWDPDLKREFMKCEYASLVRYGYEDTNVDVVERLVD